MMFRTRLLLIFTVTIVAAVGLVEVLVLASTREAFERAQAQRADVLTAQFRNEFKRRGQETVRTVTAIAGARTRSTRSRCSRRPPSTTITPRRWRDRTRWICWSWFRATARS